MLLRYYNFKRVGWGHTTTWDRQSKSIQGRDRYGRPAPSCPVPPGRPWPRLSDRPRGLAGQARVLGRCSENQLQSVSTFSPFLASALSQNGAISEVAEALEVAEAGPEVAEGVRKLPKERSGEEGWRISSQDSGRTGSKSVCYRRAEESSLTFRMEPRFVRSPLPSTLLQRGAHARREEALGERLRMPR